MTAQMRIELARESDAVDFERFVGDLGLHAIRRGGNVEILEDSRVIGDAVTEWLADSADPLVPTRLGDGALALRPPAA
jgi:hypothetical protein